ncbi:hypothetical protein C8J56DRAFT_1051727 [Mycena floridula]|nr:hypothetical protein C8J56DRAFT_1051727 [Mycena floridula]
MDHDAWSNEFSPTVGFNVDGSVKEKVDYRFDECSQTPYVYNPKTQTMVSYDDMKSFTAKNSLDLMVQKVSLYGEIRKICCCVLFSLQMGLFTRCIDNTSLSDLIALIHPLTNVLLITAACVIPLDKDEIRTIVNAFDYLSIKT